MQPKLLELRSADVLQRLLRQAQHPHFPKHLQVQSPNMPSPKVRFPHLQAPSMHTTDTHSPDVGPRPGMSPHSPEARQPAQGSSAPHQGLQHPPLHQRLQLWNQPTGPELAQPLHFSVDTRPKIQPQAWPRAHLLHAKSMPDASQAAQLCVHVSTAIHRLFSAERLPFSGGGREGSHGAIAAVARLNCCATAALEASGCVLNILNWLKDLLEA